MSHKHRKFYNELSANRKRKKEDTTTAYKVHMLNAAQRRFNLTLPEAYELREFLLANRSKATLINNQKRGRSLYEIEVPKLGKVKFVYNNDSQEIVTVMDEREEYNEHMD